MEFKQIHHLILALFVVISCVILLPAQQKTIQKTIRGYSEEKLIKEWKKWLKKFPVPDNAVELEEIKSFPSGNMEQEGVYLWHPMGIASLSNGRLVVNDQKANKILMFDLNGNFIKTFGRKGQGPGEFGNPYSMAIETERILVGDNSNMRIHFFDLKGNFISDFKIFKALFDMEIGKNGLIYGVPLRVRPEDKLVDVFNAKGEIVNSFGKRRFGGKKSNWQMTNKTDVALNENNELYMAFEHFPLVCEYSEDGELLEEFNLEHEVMKEKEAMNQEKLKNNKAIPGFGWQIVIYSILSRNDGFTILSNFPRTEILEYEDSGKIREIYYYNYNEYDTFFSDFFIVEKAGKKLFYLLKTQPQNEIVILRPKDSESN